MRAKLGMVTLIGAAMTGALWLIGAASAQGQGVITLDHAVRNCRLISSKDARLSCYDRVIDEADASIGGQAVLALRAPPPPAPLAQATLPAGPIAPPPAPQITPPPAPAQVASAVPPAKRSMEKTNGNTLKIASAKWARDGGVEITTSDGAVWHQVDSTSLRLLPKSGTALWIGGGTFGKKICQYGAESLFDCSDK